MIDEQDVRGFMRAVYETREQVHGVARFADIMGHMGLKPSSLLDLAHKPTTKDDDDYTELARICNKRGLIKSRDDRHLQVRITDWGIEYVERGL